VATIMKGLRKSPASRFATMEEFAAALDDPSMSLTPPTRTRAIGAIANSSPTRGLVAEDQEVDTALNRVFDSTQHSQRRTRSFAIWITTAVLVISALGAAMWTRDKRGTKRRIAQRVAQVEAKLAPIVPQGRAKDTRGRTTTLGITSTPRATVFIDGARVGDTPINGRTVTVGRSYQIRVERKGYRAKRETIEVTGTRPLKRSYTLQRENRR
jgi:hypothetical protein